MQSMNDLITEYTKELNRGVIQKAYRGIMSFMSELKNYMASKNPTFHVSSLYAGYMDMTYFAWTPLTLKKHGLKITIVYLHEQNSFEVWLSGANRKIQAKYIALLQHTNIGNFKLSTVGPGVDSIIEMPLDDKPDFEHPEDAMTRIEHAAMMFVETIISILVDADHLSRFDKQTMHLR